MIIPKLNEEELALFETIRHPVWCSEFLRNIDVSAEGDPWILAPYQVEMLCDFNQYVSLCCGRAIGKSETLLDKTSWYMLNNFFPHDPISIITPNRVHLDPLFSKLRRWLNTHSFLKHFVSRQGINSSIFNITAKNSFALDCRIAGTSGGGANVVGLHAAVELIDEAGYFPWGTWIELQPTFNTWVEGSQMFVSGVPTGQRDHNVLYYADQVDPNYTRFNIPQQLNPRYTDTDEIRNRKQFGGIESEDYIHLVLGRHGTPVYALFSREKMKIGMYDSPVFKVIGSKLKEMPMLLKDTLRLLPDVPRNARNIAFGIDLGYSEPTVIIVFAKVQEVWRFVVRIILTQVPYPKQQEFIAAMDLKYNPDFIGIDAGGVGLSTVQNLLHDERYERQRLYERLLPIDFNSNIHVGYDEDGEEMKERAKVYGMQQLQEMVNGHRLVFSSVDDDIITELERTVYSRSPSGNIIYRTMTERGGKFGDDHNVAAMLAFTLAWFEKYDSQFLRRKHKKLWASRWM